MSDEAEIVYKAFKDASGPLRAGDVAEATGIAKAKVSKLIKTLTAEGKLNSPKRCYYAPT
jgi:DNA-binding IclR family transcriptional regulator